MNEAEKKQYEVEPRGFWAGTFMFGDGYDVMDYAERRGWETIEGWGQAGYDLGNHPYVIVFFRDRNNKSDLVLYVENDVMQYSCPTKELRNEICDSIAFFYWKHRGEEWVHDYESVEQLPDELRGPYQNLKHRFS